MDAGSVAAGKANHELTRKIGKIRDVRAPVSCRRDSLGITSKGTRRKAYNRV